MGRTPCCDRTKVKRGHWSPEEDTTLKNYIQTFGTGGNWISLPQKAGLNCCGKSCRLRWLNYLRLDIKHGNFTPEEDNIILSLYNTIGSRWSVIASHLPGRTDNHVKNHWNTKLRKKLLPASSQKPTIHFSSKHSSPSFVTLNGALPDQLPNHFQKLVWQEPHALIMSFNNTTSYCMNNDPIIPQPMKIPSSSAVSSSEPSSSSSQEISSLSANCLENLNGSWLGNIESGEDEGFLMGLLGSDCLSYESLDG